MPELTRVPNAARPAGRFITESVLPRWDQLNSYVHLAKHNQTMNYGLRVRRMPVHQFRGMWATFQYNGDIAGGRYGRLTTLVSDQAYEACASKTLTQRYADAAGLPAAGGRAFSEEDRQQAYSQVAEGGDWVLKPDGIRSGRGASFHVNAEGFAEAWARAVNAHPQTADASPQMVLEKFYDGLTVRFFVVGGDVQAACVRVPLFVLGDGISTVGQLLEASFAHRSRNPLLAIGLPAIGSLAANVPGAPGLDDVLQDGELRLLREDGRITAGGLPYDVTDDVGDQLRVLAQRASDAIPGLGSGAIDLITPQLDSAEGAVILDADAKASVRPHRFPAFGRRRRVMAEITHLLQRRAAYWDKQIITPASQLAEDD